MRQFIRSSSLLFLLSLFPVSAFSSDWPQFRGPGGNGVAHEAAPPLQLDVDSNLLWNLKDGSIAWERRIEVEAFERMHGVNTAATSTPVTDGKWVYVYFPSFGLLAYDCEGVEQWQKPQPLVMDPQKSGVSYIAGNSG
jgi:outer membrane protein assembly factor BamB